MAAQTARIADASCVPCASVSADDQVKAYIKKIMSQLDKWMVGGKVSKLVIVITDKDTGEHVERWQFDVQIFAAPAKSSRNRGSGGAATEQENEAAAYVCPEAPRCHLPCRLGDAIQV